MSTPEARREQIRRAVIAAAAFAMNQGGPRGLAVNLAALQGVVKPLGKPATDDEVLAAVEYLLALNYLTEVKREVSPINRAWKITNTGMDFAEQEGLA